MERTSPSPLPLPDSDSREFVIEGDLLIQMCGGFPVFKVDECSLSEFVSRHFGLRWNERFERPLGRCKVIIVPVRE